MNETKWHHLFKEWKELKAERKSLDYRTARWAHRVRSEYPDGAAGDKEFHRWIEAKIGMPAKEREALLDMARAFKAIPDQATWDTQGPGPTRRVARLPPNERTEVMKEASGLGKKFDQVIRERDRVQAARRIVPIRAPVRDTSSCQDDAVTIKRWACQLSASALANALAELIADGTLSAPALVVAAAKRCAESLRRAQAMRAA